MSDSPPTQKMPAIPKGAEKQSEQQEPLDDPKTVTGIDVNVAAPSVARLRKSQEMPLLDATVEVKRTPGMPVLTAPTLDTAGPSGKKPQIQENLAGEVAMPMLTAAVAEKLPDPNAPKPAPGPATPAAAAAQAPAAAAPASLSKEKPSGASIFEQLEAMEKAEQAEAQRAADPANAPRRMVHVAPGAQVRVALTGADKGSFLPPPPSAAAPAPAPAPVEDKVPGLYSGNEGPLELDRGGWSPEPQQPKARPQSNPSARAVAPAAREYKPMTFKAPEPPSRNKTALGALVIAAAGIALAFGVLAARSEQEQLTTDLPAPAPAPVISAPVAAPKPMPASLSITVTGVAKKAKVTITLDGKVLQGTKVADLEPGPHALKIESPGMAPFDESITLLPADAREFTVALKKAKKKR